MNPPLATRDALNTTTHTPTCILLCQLSTDGLYTTTLYIYIEGRCTPYGQLIIDALNTTMPTARCKSPSQWSMDALHTTTPTARL